MKYLIKKTIQGIIRLRSLFRSKKLIRVKIGGFDMLINRDHALPRYLKERPAYSSNLPRIASYVKRKYDDLALIDVGANIGDTVALVRNKINCRIVCIEGERFYFDILEKNIKQFKDVYAYDIFLDEKEAVKNAHLDTSLGTSRISEVDASAGKDINFTTLDIFLKSHPQFKNAKILKIDTDGYDLKIIRGGINYIKEIKPIIFFEFDRFFISKTGDNGISIFNLLKEFGYHRVLFYDNAGRFILSTTIDKLDLIKQLYNYTYKKNGAFPYYDVCVFHTQDDDLANVIIGEEEKINENII